MISGRTVLIPTLVAFSLLVSSCPSLADTTDITAGNSTNISINTDPNPDVLQVKNDSPETKPPLETDSDAPTDTIEKTVIKKSDLPSAPLENDPGDIPVEPETAPPSPDNPTEVPVTAESDAPVSTGLLMMTSSIVAQDKETVVDTSTPDLPDILLSEIQVSGGTGKANNDFIEIFNRTDKNIILNGIWSLRKQTGSKNSATGIITTKEEVIAEFPEGTCIPSGASLLWINSGAESSYLAIKGSSDISNSKYITASNGIALFHDGKPIDSIQFPNAISEPFSGSKTVEDPGYTSIERNRSDFSWNVSQNPSPIGSRAASCTISINPVPPPGTIIINEFFPYPENGKEEWIELRNTGDTEISLAGWTVKDASSGAGYTFPAKTVIGANGFLILDAGTSHIALNNSGAESVTLLFPDRSIADTTSYEDARQGISFARNDTGQFIPTHTPTPGNANVFDLEERPPLTPPSGTIVINEFLPYPETGNEEWIELRNTGEEEISLAGWTLKDASTGPGYLFPTGTVIGPDGFLVIGNALSKIALNNTGFESVTLLFPDRTIADTTSYGKTERSASYARSETGLFFLTHSPTPGTGNVFDPEKILAPFPVIGTILINELFPNPKEKGEGNEWIELRNSSDTPISLVGWMLRSGSGMFVWKDTLASEYREIPAGGFLVLPRSLSKLSLRNSNGSVTLFAPDGTTVMDTVSYGATIEEASYGRFEADRFRWSKSLTPGVENVFGKEPSLKKSSIPKRGYVRTLIPFSASGNRKNVKFTWDFGDTHKSYLPVTSHRYAKSGTYQGTLTATDGTEEVIRPFTIDVGKYPKRDLHLVELCPNPAGKDTGNEWIRLRNDDKKSINLSGWIIATATDKTKLVNHVVLSDRSVGPGEEIVLTNADSRFTLPNERATIELRRPDGKTAQTISYMQDGGATENAVYTEYGDSVWAWSVPETKDADVASVKMTDETQDPTTEPSEEPGLSIDPETDGLSFGEFITLGTPYEITLPDSAPKVLGASDERLRNDTHTDEPSFFEGLFRFLNTAIISVSI
ncbi:MAG: lamin tail domain-containing protein [Candidatus Moraniibacteriota bacterium]